jgi:hypothetical protein
MAVVASSTVAAAAAVKPRLMISLHSCEHGRGAVSGSNPFVTRIAETVTNASA